MFRKVLVVSPATPLVYAAVAVKKSDPKNVEEAVVHKCRPSDLPLYEPINAVNIKKVEHPPTDSPVHRTIESGVHVVRTEVQAGLKVLGEKTQVLDTYIDTAKAHTQSTIDYLNEPHNTLPRSGAIAIGGLAGFIFAARGGFIKKVVYTGVGAGAIASLCYPRQAEQLAREALYESRKGFAIAYNFVKGVKPGDGMPIEPINKFPTTLGDVKLMLWDLYDEAKDAIFGKSK